MQKAKGQRLGQWIQAHERLPGVVISFKMLHMIVRIS
jgi:hypothetical protein